MWHALTYDNVWSFDAREHGFMIPRLKALLKDVVPGEPSLRTTASYTAHHASVIESISNMLSCLSMFDVSFITVRN